MLDYGTMRSAAIALLGVTTMSCIAQSDVLLPLAVTVTATPGVLVAGRATNLDIVLRNTGGEPIAFGTWSCAWDTQWHLRQEAGTIAIAATACSRNVPRTIRLAAGETYARSLALVARPAGNHEPVRLALGFEPLDTSHRYWSAPLTITIARPDATARDDESTP